MPRIHVVSHSPACHEVVCDYRDGKRVSMGVYGSLRDANAEMKLIREAF